MYLNLNIISLSLSIIKNIKNRVALNLNKNNKNNINNIIIKKINNIII